jgi:hypothetical protein
MKKRTGSPASGGGSAVVGVHTARYKQSSDVASPTSPDESFWLPL